MLAGMDTARMTYPVELTLTPRQIAEAFCELSDEAQAQVFIEAAALAAKWEGGGPGWQWSAVGRHLRTCACSTDGAREMVRAIAHGTQTASVTAQRTAVVFPAGHA